jgi:hypothetical protein
MRQITRALRDQTGNLPPLPGTDVVPDMLAPVVRIAPDGMRELTMMRWGFGCNGRQRTMHYAS